MVGKRGPLPKPNVLKIVEGNRGKRPINLSDGVNPPVKIPTAPKFVTGSALKEWKRITPLLEMMGLISELDMAALAMYCRAYGNLHDLELALQKKIKMLVEKEKIASYEAFEKVCTTSTPSGYKQQSVLFQLINRSREEVNRTLGHFGLSPAQRARVQPSNALQPSLPGMDEKQGFSRFAR